MKLKLRYFLIALLPVIAAAAVSCQNDDNWKPTWALPLVKEQTIRIGDFIADGDVEEVNKQVRQQWNSYVEEHFGLNTYSDSVNVDSIAYIVLVNNGDTYVTFPDNSAPVLNDSTKNLIKENLGDSPDVEAKIDQINQFLTAYYTAHPELLQNGNNPPNPMAKSKATPKSSSSGGNHGGDSAINNLLDAMIHPTDIFITAANVLSAMGSDGNNYIDSINSQIDSVLLEAQMTDSIPINFADYAKGGAISSIELYIDIAKSKDDDLPFKFNFSANFVDAQGINVNDIFKEINVDLNNPPPPLNFNKGEKELDKIVEQTQYVKFSVKCERSGTIGKEILRTLSAQGISFRVRVRVQAAMSKLTF
ncbi:MAG: hypothetical protein LBL94_03945 [Prevotellaceae bacterium]|jgi:hypothetical protein|nr:hypothetical protein [Prevotellaceae bacterium]